MAVAKHRPVLIVTAGPNGSSKTTITSKILRHEALCGMFKSDATEAELVEEYLTEKYNL